MRVNKKLRHENAIAGRRRYCAPGGNRIPYNLTQVIKK